MITTSVCSYSCWSISTCMFPIVEGKEKRNGKCVWPTISIFLGISRLISLHGAEGLTWTLDSFPLSPSLSNHSCLIFLLFLNCPLPISAVWICINLSLSIAVSLCPLCRKAGLVCLCFVFSHLCVRHASYWTLNINLWPPCSLWVKHSDIK